MMNTSDFEYVLPPELIAQHPLPERTDSRMMVVDRRAGSISHKHIRDFPGYLNPGDLLVANNTRVIPARLFGSWRDTGGKVEILLVEEVSENLWRVMSRSARRVRAGQCMLLCDEQVEGTVLEVDIGGRVLVQFSSERAFMEIVEARGVPPVPPYIQRKGNSDPLVQLDRDRYQTVYACEPGAIAAPTAGLHFSKALLDEIEKRGITCTEITLHVGPGTFRPVKGESLAGHLMESERYRISQATAQILEKARTGSARTIAIGTTTVRTLESVMREKGRFVATTGKTAIFIYPPHSFLAVDVLLTNFHLPRSTLLMLVAAFAADGISAQTRAVEGGLELMLAAYQEAIRNEYRFYSYGDSMLII